MDITPKQIKSIIQALQTGALWFDRSPEFREDYKIVWRGKNRVCKNYRVLNGYEFSISRFEETAACRFHYSLPSCRGAIHFLSEYEEDEKRNARYDELRPVLGDERVNYILQMKLSSGIRRQIRPWGRPIIMLPVSWAPSEIRRFSAEFIFKVIQCGLEVGEENYQYLLNFVRQTARSAIRSRKNIGRDLEDLVGDIIVRLLKSYWRPTSCHSLPGYIKLTALSILDQKYRCEEPNKDFGDREILTVFEAASIAIQQGLSSRAIYRAIKNKRLHPRKKNERPLRVDRIEFDRWLESRAQRIQFRKAVEVIRENRNIKKNSAYRFIKRTILPIVN